METVDDEINKEDLIEILLSFLFVFFCMCGITTCVWLIYRRAMCEEDERRKRKITHHQIYPESTPP